MSRPWAVALAYLCMFALLDWVSYIRPLQGLNVTPWNPQPALAIALLLWNRRWLPLVWLSLVAAELVVRGWPTNVFVMLFAVAALALTYAAMARALLHKLTPAPALRSLAELGWFTAIVVVGSLACGLVYVGTFVAGGSGPPAPPLEAVARYWVGEAVGLLVLLPLLLALRDAARRRQLAAALVSVEWWAIAALTLVLLGALFGVDSDERFRFFYLLLLPVVWAASRLGLVGAALVSALVQLGLIVAVQSLREADLTVFELQVLMAVLAMTALALGVANDARARAEAELLGSLRLAAAGQMAAALAHELSQPLTALSSYAHASRLLAVAPGLADGERLQRLSEVAGRMADDAQRASEVVKRLRDFFRSGSTQLQPVAAAALVNEALASQRSRAEALHVVLHEHVAPALPEVLADRVQLAVVLRNLVDNAVDATAARGAGAVTLSVALHEGQLRFDVRDDGPGLTPAQLGEVFEPGASAKPGGMGIGLGISRAIVEAHGGRLWAQAGPGGHFCVTLPLERLQAED
jgi:signal transduction histidine kinase